VDAVVEDNSIEDSCNEEPVFEKGGNTTLYDSQISKDVIEYMQMQIRCETQPGEFIYAITADSYSPYELIPVTYTNI
jgi:hypothetical protein